MRMKNLCCLLAALSLGMASCSTTKSAYGLGGEWDVVNLQGKAITPEKDVTPYLGFDLNKGHLYGFTGCNRLTGSIDAQALVNGKADFSKTGCTRMMCPDNRYEGAFLEALGQASWSKVEGNTLQLSDSKGHVVMTLKKR